MRTQFYQTQLMTYDTNVVLFEIMPVAAQAQKTPPDEADVLKSNFVDDTLVKI